MTSAAQILANRVNAQKSTGPRTAEGKAVVARNALRHGLLARVDVIPGEDREQFERQREQLLRELKPRGTVETILAKRAVSLSWRLLRVERMQNEVFETLLADEATPLGKLGRSLPGDASAGDGFGGDGAPGQRSRAEGSPGAGEWALGRAVLEDFGKGRVLDRLLMYERRMENSLLKVINDLHLRRLRNRDYISRQMDNLDSSETGESFECEVPSFKSGRSGCAAPPLQTSHFPLHSSQETPAGVTTNAPPRASPPIATPRPAHVPPSPYSAAGSMDADRMSATQVPHGSPTPLFQDFMAETSCKTKPISPQAKDTQIPSGEGIRDGVMENGREETKPISAWRAAPAAEEGRV
jgi:hypothetical protein